MHAVPPFILVTVLISLMPAPSMARQQSRLAAIKACDLLPRSEVKALIGGDQLFDMMAPEEEAVGGGSACNYPGVMIQVLPFSQSTIDAARTRGRIERVSGVGDEAYLYDNPNGYAELYTKVDARLVTIQRDLPMGKTLASVRPGVEALAKALVAKLR